MELIYNDQAKDYVLFHLSPRTFCYTRFHVANNRPEDTRQRAIILTLWVIIEFCDKTPCIVWTLSISTSYVCGMQFRYRCSCACLFMLIWCGCEGMPAMSERVKIWTLRLHTKCHMCYIYLTLVCFIWIDNLIRVTVFSKIHIDTWNAITYSCPNFNDSLAKHCWSLSMNETAYPTETRAVITSLYPNLN